MVRGGVEQTRENEKVTVAAWKKRGELKGRSEGICMGYEFRKDQTD